MNKVFFFLLACTFSVLATSCGGGSIRDKARIAELKEQINDLKNGNGQSSEKSANSSNKLGTGTYTFTDQGGHKFTLVLNEDETATITVNNKTRYGSWELYSPIGDKPLACFGGDEQPVIYFPDGEDECQFLSITDEYIYNGWQSVKAKNPRLRLPIKKIN